MRKHSFFLFITLLVSLVASCDSEGDSNVKPNGYIETTQEGAKTFVLKGYENPASGLVSLKPEGYLSSISVLDKEFSGNGYSFMPVAEKRLDAMSVAPIEGGDWQKQVTVMEGTAYWVRALEGNLYKFFKMRVAYIEGNNVGVEYVLTDITASQPNQNHHDKGMEIPALNPDYIFVEHSVEFNGQTIINLSLEWCPSMCHANWVAFAFDATTAQDNVTRTDEWAWDPFIPFEQGGVEESDHKSDGFDKGHLCASEDRVYSKEANKQTFYYSNISPQLNEFNSGFWMHLENRVRTWGRSTVSGTFDKVYVVKGGSLNHLLKNFVGEKKGMDGVVPQTDAQGFTPKGLACPAYYFMALLAEKDDSYQAIGFWVEHSGKLPMEPSASDLQTKALSIDDLEQKTGLDFFCNLPDDIETEVERGFDVDAWSW